MGVVRDRVAQIREGLFLGHDYRRTFKSPHGRRVLRDLMRNNFLLFSGERHDRAGRVDRDAMLIAEGRRQVILAIFGRIRGPDNAEEILRRELEGTSHDIEMVDD